MMRNNLLQNQEYLEKGRESLSLPSCLKLLESVQGRIKMDKVEEIEEVIEEQDEEETPPLHSRYQKEASLAEEIKFQKRKMAYQDTPNYTRNYDEDSHFIETKEILKIRDFGNDYSDEETSLFEDRGYKRSSDVKDTYYRRHGKIDSEHHGDMSNTNELLSHVKLNTMITKDISNIENEDEIGFEEDKNLSNIINNHQNHEQSLFQDSRSPKYFSKTSCQQQLNSKNEPDLNQSSLMQAKESSFMHMEPVENDMTEVTYRSNYPYCSDQRAFLQKISLGHYNYEERNGDTLGFFDYMEECKDQILVTWRLHQDIEDNEELIDFIGQKVEVQSKCRSKYII